MRVRNERSIIIRGRQEVKLPGVEWRRGVGWKGGVFGHLPGILPPRGRGTGTLNLFPPSPECPAAAPVAVWLRGRVPFGAFGPFRSRATFRWCCAGAVLVLVLLLVLVLVLVLAC